MLIRKEKLVQYICDSFDRSSLSWGSLGILMMLLSNHNINEEFDIEYLKKRSCDSYETIQEYLDELKKLNWIK